LGGLGMPFAGFEWSTTHRPTGSVGLADAWRPWIEACIEAFGSERCMFESNFPVDSYTCDYGLLWNAFKRITEGCSEAEKSALYFDTANRVYQLGLCNGSSAVHTQEEQEWQPAPLIPVAWRAPPTAASILPSVRPRSSTCCASAWNATPRGKRLWRWTGIVS